MKLEVQIDLAVHTVRDIPLKSEIVPSIVVWIRIFTNLRALDLTVDTPFQNAAQCHETPNCNSDAKQVNELTIRRK